MRYLIDSNTFIDLLKPRNPNTDKIAESLLLGDDLVIFCLVEYEVKRGYYLSFFQNNRMMFRKIRNSHASSSLMN
jgi:predicted nucleic acid-binding protein